MENLLISFGADNEDEKLPYNAKTAQMLFRIILNYFNRSKNDFSYGNPVKFAAEFKEQVI